MPPSLTALNGPMLLCNALAKGVYLCGNVLQVLLQYADSNLTCSQQHRGVSQMSHAVRSIAPNQSRQPLWHFQTHIR